MEFHEYLDELTQQIRSKNAKKMVEQELKAHIEDQAKAYEASGMEPGPALDQAVKDMGDPVEVGIEMDRIHRPRSGFKLLLLIILFSAAGLLAQYMSFYRFGTELAMYQKMAEGSFSRQCLYTVLGIILMAVIYYVDYSVIIRCGWKLGLAFLAVLAFACSGFYSLPVLNGSHSYLKCILYLFIPMYGGILYQCRKHGYMGIGAAFLWLAAAFWVGAVQVGGGLGVTLDMAVICYLMLLMAVRKGWFQVEKRLASAAVLCIPVLAGVMGLIRLAPYQIRRLEVMVHPERYADTSGYQAYTAMGLVKKLTWFGTGIHGGADLESLPIGSLPGVHYDYMMLQIASVWGILAVCILAGALAVLLIYLFHMVNKQKNQIGQVAGFGCVMVLAAETVRNLLNNFGFYTLSTGGLPFLSYGRSHTLAVYALLGVLLSIYRYQDLIFEHIPCKKEQQAGVLARFGKYRIRIERL